jgi:hypothetical protein
MLARKPVLRGTVLPVIVVGTVIGIAGPAQGQIIWESPEIHISDFYDSITFPPGDDPVGALVHDPSGLATSLHLQGDAWVSTDDEGYRGGEVRNQCYFEVSPFPVEVQLVLDYEYKIAVGGGLRDNQPTAEGDVLVSLFETHGFGPFLRIISQSDPQVGNGWSVVTPPGLLASDSYVLSPGSRYLLMVELDMIVSENSEFLPTSVVTYEFGGLTGYDGVTGTLLHRVVPEPSTLTLLTIGALTLTVGLWRRRRAA